MYVLNYDDVILVCGHEKTGSFLAGLLRAPSVRSDGVEPSTPRAALEGHFRFASVELSNRTDDFTLESAQNVCPPVGLRSPRTHGAH